GTRDSTVVFFPSTIPQKCIVGTDTSFSLNASSAFLAADSSLALAQEYLSAEVPSMLFTSTLTTTLPTAKLCLGPETFKLFSGTQDFLTKSSQYVVVSGSGWYQLS